jgi:hypothetical protein
LFLNHRHPLPLQMSQFQYPTPRLEIQLLWWSQTEQIEFPRPPISFTIGLNLRKIVKNQFRTPPTVVRSLWPFNHGQIVLNLRKTVQEMCQTAKEILWMEDQEWTLQGHSPISSQAALSLIITRMSSRPVRPTTPFANKIRQTWMRLEGIAFKCSRTKPLEIVLLRR